MTGLEAFLSILLLLSIGLVVAQQRRYLALQRKYKILQRLYDQAENQLSTLWTSKKE